VVQEFQTSSVAFGVVTRIPGAARLFQSRLKSRGNANRYDPAALAATAIC
jgi:hypothetical protein